MMSFKRWVLMFLRRAQVGAWGLCALVFLACSPGGKIPHSASLVNNVFGDDNRSASDTQSYPYSAIGRLDSGCTGTLLSPTLVLTAAHCVVKKDTGRLRPELSYFRPAYSQENPRSLTQKVWIQEFWYGTHQPEEERLSDWAVLRLASPVENYGFMKVVQTPPLEDLPLSVELSGYSTDKNASDIQRTHRFCNILEKDASGRLLHDCDSTAGISGAALFRPLARPGEEKAQIVGLAVSEFRKGAKESVYRDAYEADYANVAAPTSRFIDVVEELLARGREAPAGQAIPGAFYMANTNVPPPDERPSTLPPPPDPRPTPPQVGISGIPLTRCPKTSFQISAPILTRETFLMERSACSVAQSASVYVNLASGRPHPALYDFASALSVSSTELCSILNTFRMGGMDYVTASYRLAPHLCSVLTNAEGIDRYVLTRESQLLAVDPAIRQRTQSLVYETQNLGRFILRMNN